MKELKDYLHLYLGCDFMHDSGKFGGFISGINFHHATVNIKTEEAKNHPRLKDHPSLGFEKKVILIERIKPILRPLSDMTEEEADYIIEHTKLKEVSMGRSEKEFAINIAERWTANADVLAWLLSKHFDLFNLIPEGLAIDKSTINK